MGRPTLDCGAGPPVGPRLRSETTAARLSELRTLIAKTGLLRDRVPEAAAILDLVVADLVASAAVGIGKLQGRDAKDVLRTMLVEVKRQLSH